MHFILLLKRQWFENRKTWLIGLLGIAAILAALLLLTWHWRTSFNGDTTRGIFLVLLFVGGGLFISSILKDLGNKQKGIWLLILPAPVASKLAVAIFYGILVYLLVYFGVFYAIRELMLAFFGKEAANWGEFDLFKNNFYYFIFNFINFQSLVLLGSVYFNKIQFIKTVLVIIAGFFIAFNANAYLLQLITDENAIVSNTPLGGFIFSYKNENIAVNPHPNTEIVTAAILWVAVPVVLWLAAWFRIREKQL